MKQLIDDLNILLATTATLAQKVSNLHWNMKGKMFMQYHKMTDELYEGLHDFIDPLAEKIIMQKGMPYSTLKSYVENSLIKEIEPKIFTTEEVIEILIQDLETYCAFLEKATSNQYVQPLYDEIFMFVDKHRWFFSVSK